MSRLRISSGRMVPAPFTIQPRPDNWTKRRLARIVLFPHADEPVTVATLGWAPLIAVGWLLWFISGHGGGGDFMIFRNAGEAVLHGQSPYVEPSVRALAENDKFVYPAPFAYLFAPFAVLPAHVAAALFLLLSALAVGVSIRLLGVRDWRCIGAALLGAPTFGALGVGSIGPLLLLLIAAGWRVKGSIWAGPLLAIAAAAKLFLWPVLIWLLLTRRLRASAAAIATIIGLLSLWLAVDGLGLRHYPSTVRDLNIAQRWKSYSPQTFALSLGAPVHVALAVSVVLAVGVVAAIVGWRRDERLAFALAVVGSLVASPILWMHYLVLLLVPLALWRPAFTRLWLLPVALWLTPHPESLGSSWRIAYALALVAAVVVLAGPLTVARTDRSRPVSAA